MEIDVQRKRANDEIPPGVENKMQCFSMSKKFTRVANGTNKIKTMPVIKRYKPPLAWYCELYFSITMENKKRWAPLPFVD